RTDYALIRHNATGGTPSAPASPTTSTPSSRSVSPVSSIHDEVGQGGKRKADDAADPEAKRKKVKPSKKAQEGVVPTAAARKAGRPPKKAGDTATAVAGPPPVKRGRGRPKRTDTGSTTTPAAAAPPNASVPKPKKRKQSDDNTDGPPAKKQKQQPVAPAPAPTGRGTHSRGGPRAPSPTVPGRMIGAHFYPQGTRLPDGYSWQDTFAVVHEKEKRVRNEHYKFLFSLRNVFEKCLNPPETLPESFDSAQHKMNRILAHLIPETTSDSSEERFSSAEWTEANIAWVKDQIRKHGLHSASGEDAILYAEILEIPNDVLAYLCNECIRRKDGPSAWFRTVIIGLLKKGKLNSDPDSYRIIALESCVLKILMLLIHKRITDWATAQGLIPDYQNGII
ncbi:hypothetical protein B0H11DRAFT_2254277, partial [Mycena galericulata]